VLHEFGHALGFDHEHQIPLSACQTDFRWDNDPGYVETRDADGEFVPDDRGRNPGLYTAFEGPPNNWSKETDDFNLKELAFSKDTRLAKTSSPILASEWAVSSSGPSRSSFELIFQPRGRE
jgi:hypothetical protein